MPRLKISANKTQLLFVLLQLGDVVTTMMAIRMGGSEQNTLVSHLMVVGSLQGLLFSKVLVLALAVAAGVADRPRVLRWANIVFSGVVLWNLSIIARLAAQSHPL